MAIPSYLISHGMIWPGLGYKPSISLEVIRGAGVILFNGNMKPWLDVAFNWYKALWTKHVEIEM